LIIKFIARRFDSSRCLACERNGATESGGGVSRGTAIDDMPSSATIAANATTKIASLSACVSV